LPIKKPNQLQSIRQRLDRAINGQHTSNAATRHLFTSGSNYPADLNITSPIATLLRFIRVVFAMSARHVRFTPNRRHLVALAQSTLCADFVEKLAS
jgi:hypothetical protein